MERICAQCGRPIRDERQTGMDSPTKNENNRKNQRKNTKGSGKLLCINCETEMKIRVYEMQIEM
jgi:hypothetical protein